MNESAEVSTKLSAMLRQTPACYWAIFDKATKRRVYVAGSDFGSFSVVERLIYDNSELVKSASSLEGLATAAGLPGKPLVETVRRYNAMLDAGEDQEFQRFTRRDDRNSLPPKIENPPYYAVRIYPLTRKNMGGVLTDHSCRVVDAHNRPIPSLYAAGELSGFAGINGTSALEGTFLGPCVVTGRMAGRTAVADAQVRGRQKSPQTERPVRNDSSSGARAMTTATGASNCTECHDLKGQIELRRPGYTHFEKSHQRVLDRRLDCLSCHSELSPYQPQAHEMDRTALSHHCGDCHLSKDG